MVPAGDQTRLIGLVATTQNPYGAHEGSTRLMARDLEAMVRRMSSITTSSKPLRQASRSATVPLIVRMASVAAAVWAAGFVAVNLWVQVAAADNDAFVGSLIGLAVLNMVAFGMKIIGAVVALRARRPVDPRLVGAYAAVLTTAAVTLLGWGVVSLVAALRMGGLTDSVSLAGGLFLVPAWLYPAAFGLGAIVFAPPARHLMRQARRPRLWTAIAVTVGPSVVVGIIAVTAWILTTRGLLNLT